MEHDLREAKALFAEADTSTSTGDDWALRQIDAWNGEGDDPAPTDPSSGNTTIGAAPRRPP